MTKEDLIAALEGHGFTDVWLMERPVDAGAKHGVGVSFMDGGKVRRNAVSMPASQPIEAAYPVLLDWATEDGA